MAIFFSGISSVPRYQLYVHDAGISSQLENNNSSKNKRLNTNDEFICRLNYTFQYLKGYRNRVLFIILYFGNYSKNILISMNILKRSKGNSVNDTTT